MTYLRAVERYRNLSGNAGVRAFELGPAHIIVQFEDGSTYLYNEVAPGARDVETMRSLARQGQGLTTFINTHVRERYARKLR